MGKVNLSWVDSQTHFITLAQGGMPSLVEAGNRKRCKIIDARRGFLSSSGKIKEELERALEGHSAQATATPRPRTELCWSFAEPADRAASTPSLSR